MQLDVGKSRVVPAVNGKLVVVLTEKDEVTQEEFAKDKEAILARLRKLKQHDALVAYVARLRQQAEGQIRMAQELQDLGKEKESSDS